MHKISRQFIQGMTIAGLLALTACSEQPPEQLAEEYGIAYIKRPVATEVDDDTGNVVLVDSDLREVLDFAEGADIWYRDSLSPAAPERNITACITGGKGDVRDLEVSYDGSRLIFALHVPDDLDDPEFTWDIYEYDIASGACPQRVIRSNILAGEGDDLAPHYLPDGRIVFTSTRQKASGAVLTEEGKSRFRALDERRREHAPLLHVMSASGENIRQISFNQSHDLDPTVLASGEILFTRWDRMGPRDAMSLYKVRPDGTDLKMVYGVHDHATGTNGATVQYTRPRQLEDGRVLTMLRPFNGTAGGGLPALIDIDNYIDNRQPTWSNQGVLGGTAQSTIIDLDLRSDGSISPAGRYRDLYPMFDGSNRVLASWSPCRLLDGNNEAQPCPAEIPANAVEALPFYGIYLLDLTQQTQLPIVIPRSGTVVEEPVIAAPRTRPATLYDKVAGIELDQDLTDENVGLLHIRSVYDMDGGLSGLGSGITSLSQLADPSQVTSEQRPAQFLRIVKAVSIPDRDTYRFDRSAFGRSRAMREIIGYAPIQPDGSVLVKVPANVPLSISVVDGDGQRIGPRHQNWLQLRAGETVTCNGCHDHTPSAPAGQSAPLPLPHGTSETPPPLNSGAATSGAPFPGTDASLLAEMGETMAQTRIRLACSGSNAAAACPHLSPSVNLLSSNDWWSDPLNTPATVTQRPYSDQQEPTNSVPSAPTTATCQTRWDANCRIVINYEDHIHPLWSKARPLLDSNGIQTDDRVCTACHSNLDPLTELPRVPAAQLDLGDGPSDQDPDHFKSFRELLFTDNRQVLNEAGTLVDETREVPLLDENGNQVFQTTTVTDPVTGEVSIVQVLDDAGNPIPLFELVPVSAGSPAMVSGRARSSRFMGVFLPGGSHAGDLSEAELRLVAEWLDIGAQYFNNPFDAPMN